MYILHSAVAVEKADDAVYCAYMEKISTENKKLLQALNTKLKDLQAQLVEANKLEGKDAFIDVRLEKNQARFKRVKRKDEEDTAIGMYFIEIHITAKQDTVFIPLSIASGKKTAGFMYQIEGTAPGSIASADVKLRGDGVSQVTLGTLFFAKIPTGKTGVFQIHATTRGNFGKEYKLVFTRLNYKLRLTDQRYLQYLKEIHSESVRFS